MQVRTALVDPQTPRASCADPLMGYRGMKVKVTLALPPLVVVEPEACPKAGGYVGAGSSKELRVFGW